MFGARIKNMWEEQLVDPPVHNITCVIVTWSKSRWNKPVNPEPCYQFITSILTNFEPLKYKITISTVLPDMNTFIYIWQHLLDIHISRHFMTVLLSHSKLKIALNLIKPCKTNRKYNYVFYK